MKSLQSQLDDLFKRMAAIEEKLNSLSSSPPSPSPGAGEVWKLTKKIEAKQAMADDLRRRFSHEAALGIHWQDMRSKAAYTTLIREIRELNERIANS